MRTKRFFAYGLIAVLFALAFIGCEMGLGGNPGGTDDGTKVDPTVTWPRDLKASKGTTLASVQIDCHANMGGEPGVFSWTTPNTSLGELGEFSHNMTFTPDDRENYNTLKNNVTVTVIDACVTHTWGEWLVTKDPTETEDGTETRTCTVSNTAENRILYATGTAGLTYTFINGETEYRVTRGTKPVTDFPTLHIPAYWRPADSDNYDDYKPVTEIGNSAGSAASSSFGATNSSRPNNTLTSLTFAENRQPTIIHSYAFSYCTELTEVTIPENVTIKTVSTAYGARNGAFQGCTGLKSVTLSPNVTISGSYVFADCTGLTKVNISSGVTISGDYAFDKCTGITSVTIPSGVTISGTHAFANCTGITNVNISSDITGALAFRECKNITSVTLNNGLTTIGSSMFMGCSGLTSITLPESVTTIGNQAFGYTGLTSITIPSKVTILNSAFQSCTNLTSINFGNITSFGSLEFYGCTGLTEITIPESVTTIESNAFYGCTGLVNINVAAGNQHFASQDGILYNKTKTDLVRVPSGRNGTIAIPTGVTSIGASAFSGCTGITGITIPEGVTTIGNEAFYNCTGITSITLPESVTTIGNQAFTYTGLITVTIPSKVTVLSTAFQHCTNLTSIDLGNITTISSSAFNGCTGITKITIPASVTTIQGQAFSACTSLASVTFMWMIPKGTVSYQSQFRGDLFTKFYATDSQNGTPGTYTTPSPSASSPVWTLQSGAAR